MSRMSSIFKKAIQVQEQVMPNFIEEAYVPQSLHCSMWFQHDEVPPTLHQWSPAFINVAFRHHWIDRGGLVH
ncbi:hypothetical protein NPIL_213151 [Nephila pilipes]|uniref:Uncharacterized protein n=1 Tax=Nephila pilipes TaxID=299642 RepID=A0A8X6R3L9_NEPPI|nr:hypothetical protein NPIL_213151 [Nephila pilipes]